MKRVLVAAVVCALMVGTSGVTWAEDEDVIDGMIEACGPEIEAYCSQVTLGEGRLLACFYAHEDKISGRCSYALYEGAAKLEQFAAALTHLAVSCQDDLVKFCGEVEVGEGRVGTCLLEHKSEVTEVCAQAIVDTDLKAVEE